MPFRWGTDYGDGEPGWREKLRVVLSTAESPKSGTRQIPRKAQPDRQVKGVYPDRRIQISEEATVNREGNLDRDPRLLVLTPHLADRLVGSLPAPKSSGRKPNCDLDSK